MVDQVNEFHGFASSSCSFFDLSDGFAERLFASKSMDSEEEEVRFLGFFGICREAFAILFRWRKVFSQLSLSFILPLSFTFLAHHQFSDFFYRNIIRRTPEGEPAGSNLPSLFLSDFTIFDLLIQALYFIFFSAFYLLSTSSLVYATASLYTGRELTFFQILTVLPKVWLRLFFTFLCVSLSFLIYHFLAAFMFILIFLMKASHTRIILFFIVLILYLMGLVYITVAWQLANVVSVLEEARGFKAMEKSKALLRGNMRTAGFVVFNVSLSLLVLQLGFENLVRHGWISSLVGRMGLEIVIFILVSLLFLLGIVAQTVLYLVCKSYHHESINKSALSDHLGLYVPLKSNDDRLLHLQLQLLILESVETC